MDIKLHIDVGTEAPAHRLRLWKHFIHTRFFGLDCESDVEDFRGSIRGRKLDMGLIARSITSRQVMTRTSSLINQTTDATALFAHVISGSFTLDQDGHSFAVSPGEFFLLDASRPFRACITSDTIEVGLLHVPKTRITQRIGGTGFVAFETFGPDCPVQRLTLNFVSSLFESLDRLDTGTANTLFDQSLDLFALMVAQGKTGSVDPSTHRARLLMRVKAYIKSHLRDEHLTINGASRALGISSRYINVLFEMEQTSFGRHVLARRLEGARREITDPRRAHAQVTELAYNWGFSNPSHFGRAFKHRYGVTPREAKMEGLSA